MLVLTRKQNEKVRIGDSITITVLRMKGKAVRLGIEAPQDVNVIRGELCFELSGEDADESATKNGATDAGISPRRGKPTVRPCSTPASSNASPPGQVLRQSLPPAETSARCDQPALRPALRLLQKEKRAAERHVPKECDALP